MFWSPRDPHCMPSMATISTARQRPRLHDATLAQWCCLSAMFCPWYTPPALGLLLLVPSGWGHTWLQDFESTADLHVCEVSDHEIATLAGMLALGLFARSRFWACVGPVSSQRAWKSGLVLATVGLWLGPPLRFGRHILSKCSPSLKCLHACSLQS